MENRVLERYVLNWDLMALGELRAGARGFLDGVLCCLHGVVLCDISVVKVLKSNLGCYNF